MSASKPRVPFYSASALAFSALFSGCAVVPSPSATSLLLPDVRAALAQADKPVAAPNKVPERVARDLLPPLVLAAPVLSPKQVEPRFDLNISNATPQQLFAGIVTDTRYSMLISPDLKGNLTLRLKDVTVKETLDAVRELYGYEYRIDGARIFVTEPAMQTQMFKVNYLTSSRSGRSEVRVVSGSISGGSSGGSSGSTGGSGTGSNSASASSGGSGQESSRVTTQSRNDLWAELETTLKLMIGEKDGRQVVVSPQTSTVIVRGMPKDMRVAMQYLDAARLSVERQVMLEAKIVEVKLTDSAQSGINWAVFKNAANSRLAAGLVSPGAQLQPVGALSSAVVQALPGLSLSSAAAATAGAFGLAFQTSNFAALLSFLETQGSVQVLSSPRIATLNNQKAVLKVGTDDFFVTNVSTSTTSGSGNSGNITSPSITVQPFFSGIALDVTPQIDADGNIILHVHPSVSAVQERSKVVNLGSLGSFTLPLASSSINETDSVVRVQDGNIVAIGGLMRQQSSLDKSQIPVAGDLPGVGGLFGQRGRELSKQELVILIKPTVVHSEPSSSVVLNGMPATAN
ncbi:MAG: secretin N-terminal domain-containing protein [Pseudorhodobacter sp.]|nr:secretin N-terminal domain-containing protein [Rhizobacter sp.]